MSSAKLPKPNSPLSLTALLVFVGCAPPSLVREEPQRASFSVPGGLDLGSTPAVYPGPLDLKNRYLSNVVVLSTDPATYPGGCSGVLITPSKVLTAGHCVCARREVTASDRERIEKRLNQAAPFNPQSATGKDQLTRWKSNLLGGVRTITDSSNCLARARVIVISYLGAASRIVPAEYQGSTVRPHPSFLSLDDSDSRGLFRDADLAIIDLAEPVMESVRAIKLPTAEVRLDDSIVMVGYGLGETEYPKTAFGFRHFGESRVTRIDRLASGSARFAAQGLSLDGGAPSRIQAGDSGGGGFSKADDTVLLGIVSSSSEEYGSIFESTYPHRKWLDERMNEDL